jgi:lysophospholipase L1-like esterase
MIAALAGSFLWIPYAVPGIESLQVVQPGDPIPLSALITRTPRQGGATLAGALRRRTLLAEDDESLMEVAPLPHPLHVEPRRSRRRAGAGDDDRMRTPLPRVDTEDYEGLTREIEDPHGSLRRFYRQLGRVVRGRPVLARMGVYGTSMNGADRTTSQLRRLLQRRFGDGGKGFVPVAAGWRYQRQQDVEWRFDGWRTFVVNRGDGPLDRYGYGGVVATNRTRRAESVIGTVGGDGPGTRVGHFTIFHQAWPGGGDLDARVDDGAPRTISTRAAQPTDRIERIDVADGAHRLTLRAGSDGLEDLRLYGVAMERDGPGVVVDGLGLVGAFTRVLRLFGEGHIERQVQQRDPDLLVFWMGANDAVSRSVPFDPPQHRAHYRGILRRFRAASPTMSCMVMSILDKGERVNGRVRTRERVPRMVALQREIALAEGCAFFDTYEATGGDGTMGRWYTSSPRLVTSDLGHLTAAGSRVTGTLLYRALLKGYDDWIADGEPEPGER